MRSAPDRYVTSGLALKDNATFFRSGTSGEGRELLTAAELARYDARCAAGRPGLVGLAAPPMMARLSLPISVGLRRADHDRRCFPPVLMPEQADALGGPGCHVGGDSELCYCPRRCPGQAAAGTPPPACAPPAA